MSVVYKFPLHFGNAPITMPVGAVILSAQLQHGAPHVWALCGLQGAQARRDIRVFGTGHEFDAGHAHFVGTIQQAQFVWHVFDFGELSD